MTSILDTENLATGGVQVTEWNVRPFQLVSLLEMLKKHAFTFYVLGGTLRSVVRLSELTKNIADKPLAKDTKEKALRALLILRNSCEQIEFDLAIKGADWALKELAQEGITNAQHAAIIGELERRVTDELSSNLFFHVPMGRAKYYPSKDETYETKPLLSAAALKKFPRSTEDMEEAGKCFALGRYTACVFHLMRVMERGVQRLGKKLKVTIPVEEKDWGKISTHVNGALNRLPNSTVQEKRIHARYTKAAVYLDNVRESWRNPTMHPKETYTDEEAEDCLRFVKQYMEFLATIL